MNLGSLISDWRRHQEFLGVRDRDLAALALASTLAGFTEATVLALVVNIAVTLQTDGEPEVGIGPLAIDGVSVATLLWLAFGIALVRLALQWVGVVIPARLSTDNQARLRARSFRSFTNATWQLQSQDREGQLQELATAQSARASKVVLAVGTGLAAACTFAAMLVSAVVIDPIAATLVIACAIILFFALNPLSRRARKAATELTDAGLSFAGGLSEAVRITPEARVFGVQAAQNEMIDEQIAEIYRPFYRSQLLNRVVAPVYQSATILVLVAGLGLLYATDTTGLQSLGAVVLVLLRTLSYSQSLQSAHQQVADLLPSLERVRDSIERYEASTESFGDAQLDHITRIEFRQVSYSYIPAKRALSDIDLIVDRGEAVGVIGPSGAGKSTFVQLLLRLRSPDTGEILVNGLPASAYAVESWSRRVAYVPQDSQLIAGTVSENIRFYRPWITDDDVVRAAKLAHIHGEISEWEAGYDTMVGQRADAISGGQRQRVTIARALAGRPDVLVLDEPTSALDVPSEREVQHALSELRGELTLFIIAHRMSTLNICNRLLVFEDGRLSATGTHADLEAMDGFYQDATRTSLGA